MRTAWAINCCSQTSFKLVRQPTPLQELRSTAGHETSCFSRPVEWLLGRYTSSDSSESAFLGIVEKLARTTKEACHHILDDIVDILPSRTAFGAKPAMTGDIATSKTQTKPSHEPRAAVRLAARRYSLGLNKFQATQVRIGQNLCS